MEKRTGACTTGPVATRGPSLARVPGFARLPPEIRNLIFRHFVHINLEISKSSAPACFVPIPEESRSAGHSVDFLDWLVPATLPLRVDAHLLDFEVQTVKTLNRWCRHSEAGRTISCSSPQAPRAFAMFQGPIQQLNIFVAAWTVHNFVLTADPSRDQVVYDMIDDLQMLTDREASITFVMVFGGSDGRLLRTLIEHCPEFRRVARTAQPLGIVSLDVVGFVECVRWLGQT